MPLSSFAKSLSNVKQRAGGVFVYDGSVYRSLGVVRNVALSWTPVTTEADTAGRRKMLAADITLTFVMQQTSNTELGALDSLLAPSGNGLQLKVTSEHTDTTGASSADGYVFYNAIPVVEGQIQFTGEESSLTFTINGRVAIDELVKLGTNKELTFDA